MNWFWHALWISLVIIPTTLLWLTCVISIFVRDDLSLGARLGWLLAIFLLPVFGAIAYILFSPTLWHATDRETIGGVPAAEYRAAMRDSSGEASLASDMATISRLHESGALTDSEFDAAKSRLLRAFPRARSDDPRVTSG